MDRGFCTNGSNMSIALKLSLFLFEDNAKNYKFVCSLIVTERYNTNSMRVFTAQRLQANGNSDKLVNGVKSMRVFAIQCLQVNGNSDKLVTGAGSMRVFKVQCFVPNGNSDMLFRFIVRMTVATSSSL